MRFDPIEKDNPVCLRGVFVHKHRLMAHAGNADLNSFHGAFHRTAHSFFGNAIVLEDLKLALGSGAAVAAHCCHNIGRSALGLDKIHNGAGHQGIMVNPPAAAGNGNLLSGQDLAADLRAIQFPEDDAGNVAFGNAGLVKVLANPDHFGDRCVFDEVRNGFHSLFLSCRRAAIIIQQSYRF